MNRSKYLRSLVAVILAVVVVVGLAPVPAYAKTSSKTSKKATTYTLEELYVKTAPACVEVRSIDSVDQVYVGSGFFIGKSKILTNAHVIESASRIELYDLDGNPYTLTKILAYDETSDIAVLKVKEKNPNYLKFSKNFEVGEDVFTIGNPVGIIGTCMRGIVSNRTITVRGNKCIQVNMSSGTGIGGAPLLNFQGKVIGVMCYTVPSGNNMNMALCGEDVQTFVANITAKDAITLKKFYAGNKDKYVTPNVNNFLSEYNKDNTTDAFAMSRMEMTPKEIYDETLLAMVSVDSCLLYGNQYISLGGGSGFFIDSNHIYTARHVVENNLPQNILVVDIDGNVYQGVSITLADNNADIAKLEIELVRENEDDEYPIRHNNVVTNPYYTPAVGETVYALGNPEGYIYTISKGTTLMPTAVNEGSEYIMHSAPTSSGSSGGVLLNKYGEVIGLTNMLLLNVDNICLAVKIAQAP